MCCGCCQCHRVNDQLPRAALTVDSPVYILESTRRGGRLVQFCSTFCPTHSQICPNTFSIMRISPRKCNLNTSSIYSTVANQFRFNYYQTYENYATWNHWMSFLYYVLNHLAMFSMRCFQLDDDEKDWVRFNVLENLAGGGKGQKRPDMEKHQKWITYTLYILSMMEGEHGSNLVKSAFSKGEICSES